jgi:hypothetical protein
VTAVRARQIKPGFFKNEILAACVPHARLLFIGLWQLADREGRLEDRPTRIKAELFPYEALDTEMLLRELASKTNGSGKPELLLRYSTDVGRFIQIVNFTKHQQPHYKEVPSSIQPPPDWQDSEYLGGGVPESVRVAVIERDGKRCLRCRSTRDLTVDHIVPRSRGGSNDESNLQTLCRKCNSAKNNRISAQEQPDVSPTLAEQSRASRASSPIPSSLIPPSLTVDSKERPTGRAPAKKFIPPTAEEVQAYLDELGERRFTGEAFVDGYQQKGWKAKGGEAIKDWQAAVRNWIHMRDQRGEGQPGAPLAAKTVQPCADCKQPMTKIDLLESARFCRACRQDHGV